MTASRVQGKSAFAVGVTTVTATLDAPATLGNILIVGCRANNSVTINTPTDTGSHTYLSAVGPISAGALRAQMYYAVQTTGGVTQVTFTTSGNATVEISVEEYAGVQRVSPLGATSSLTGTTETSLSVTSFSTTSGSLIVAFATQNTGGTFTAGTNYTLGLDGSVIGTEYRLNSGTSETAPFTTDTAGTLWIELAAEFLPAVAVTATLSGTGNLSGTFTVSVPLTSTISGTGNIAGTFTVSIPVTATVSGAGSIGGTFTVSVPVAASVSGSGNLTASATIDVPVAASVSGSGNMTASATITVPLGATISGTGSTGGEFTVTVNLGGTLTGTAGTGGSPTISTTIGATLTGLGSMSGTVLEAAARGVLRLSDALKALFFHSHQPKAVVSPTDEQKGRLRMTDEGDR